MTDEKMAVNWIRSQGWSEETLPSDEFGQMFQAYLAGLKAGRDMAETDLAIVAYMQGTERYKTKWHKCSERPRKKINALCFDIKQNKFILGFYDLEADEWLRYGGYETIHIDLWKEIVLPKEEDKEFAKKYLNQEEIKEI